MLKPLVPLLLRPRNKPPSCSWSSLLLLGEFRRHQFQFHRKSTTKFEQIAAQSTAASWRTRSKGQVVSISARSERPARDTRIQSVENEVKSVSAQVKQEHCALDSQTRIYARFNFSRIKSRVWRNWKSQTNRRCRLSDKNINQVTRNWKICSFELTQDEESCRSIGGDSVWGHQPHGFVRQRFYCWRVALPHYFLFWKFSYP